MIVDRYAVDVSPEPRKKVYLKLTYTQNLMCNKVSVSNFDFQSTIGLLSSSIWFFSKYGEVVLNHSL